MERRWLALICALGGACVAGSAFAACPPATAASSPAKGAAFEAATRMDTQTSNDVRITGGCIDVPDLFVGGTRVNASGGGGSGDVVGPSSATNNNLAAFNGTTGKLIKDSGVLTSAVLVSGGALGTPSSGTLTNATGYPTANLAGAGTGVLTALGVNVGSAGAVLVNGGALGTPSSGMLTSATGLPISTGVSGLGTGVATALAVNTGSAGAFTKNNGDALSGTFSGNFTFSGVPSFTNALAGTQDRCLGLSAANALVTSVGACGTGGGGGGGDVVGPTGATDNRIAAFDGATGKLIKDGGILVSSLFTSGGALGTPSSGTLTNTTGFPVANLAGAGSGVLTLLATPTSANLASALTDETGTGAAVFAASPALSGTPTAPTASGGTNTTQLATTAFVLANAGSTGFGVQGGQVPATVGDSNSSIAAGKYKVTISASLTAARTYTLPSSATFGVGCMGFLDPLGTITSTNTATLLRTGSDTVNGGTSLVIGVPNGSISLCSDGAGVWTSFGGNGIAPLTAASNQFLTGLLANGNFTRAQPAFTDLSGGNTVSQIAGGAASHAVPVDVAGTSTWKVVPDCTDTGGNHLNFTQSTDAFSCGTSGGGGSGLISTQTASNSATLEWTGLATFNNYRLSCRNLIPAGNGTTPYIQFGTGGTPTWATSGYEWGMNGISTGSSYSSGGSTSDSGISFIGGSSVASAGEGVWVDALIYGLASAVRHAVTTTSGYGSVTPSYIVGSGAGRYNTATTAVTAVRIIMSSGNLASGSCSLYSVGT